MAIGTNSKSMQNLDANSDDPREFDSDDAPIEGVVHFSENPVVAMVGEMKRLASLIPSYASIEASGFDKTLVANANNQILQLNQYLISLRAEKGMKHSIDRFEHDQNNVMVVILSGMELLNMYCESGMTPSVSVLEMLKSEFDRSVSLFLRNCSVSIALATRDYNYVQTNLRSGLVDGFSYLAGRRGYELMLGDSSTPIKQGAIMVDIPDTLSPGVDIDCLVIALDNLLRNSMDIASRRSEGKVAIKISARLTPYDCVEIVVRDTGSGLKYFALFEKYLREAHAKMSNSEELTSFDNLMLRHTVTHPDIAAKLFERGESPSGSTGLGLSTVKDIIDGHDGHIEIDNHPDGGVSVRILIPDTDSKDRVERARILTTARLAMEAHSDDFSWVDGLKS